MTFKTKPPRGGRRFHAGWIVAALLVAHLAMLSGCGKTTGTEYTSEGSLMSPLALPDALTSGIPVTWDGTVGALPSYYFVNINPLLKYRVSMTGLSADADLYVYAAPLFVNTTAICASVTLDTNAEICDWTGAVPMMPVPQLYLLVKSVDPAGAQFTLDISPQ